MLSPTVSSQSYTFSFRVMLSFVISRLRQSHHSFIISTPSKHQTLSVVLVFCLNVVVMFLCVKLQGFSA